MNEPIEFSKSGPPPLALHGHKKDLIDPWKWWPDVVECKYRKVSLRLTPCKRLVPSWYCEILEIRVTKTHCDRCTVDPKT